MQTQIAALENGNVRVTFEFAPGATMMGSERNLQAAANGAVAAATGECLSRFDTDGAPIVIGGKKLTTKGKKSKIYQSPGGPVSVSRHVYQGSGGGRIFCPMEQAARVVRTATALFARQVASKYANSDSGTATRDFAEHGREIARTYVREVGSDVALIASEKEEVWEFAVPQAPPGKRVKTVSVGVDGTCMLMCKEEGWREVMVGTIALYDGDGERLHTTYVAAAPEHGKETFYTRMERELAAVKEVYPDVRYAGVADGAACNWTWIGRHTTWHILDFWHATEYLHAASAAIGGGEAAQQGWAEQACHRLKHERGAAGALLGEMIAKQQAGVRGKTKREALAKAISYFENNQDKMDYATYRAMGLSIGSGVTEAACKSIAKARMCGSGMRWDTKGAAEVLSLRTMVKTEGRWDEFWEKVGRHGFTKITAPKRQKKQ
jgi:hypothetical protein